MQVRGQGRRTARTQVLAEVLTAGVYCFAYESTLSLNAKSAYRAPQHSEFSAKSAMLLHTVWNLG